MSSGIDGRGQYLPLGHGRPSEGEDEFVQILPEPSVCQQQYPKLYQHALDQVGGSSASSQGFPFGFSLGWMGVGSAPTRFSHGVGRLGAELHMKWKILPRFAP